MVVSPAGGSRIGEERHPDSVSDPDDAQQTHFLASPSVNQHKRKQQKRSAASCLGNSANGFPQSSLAVADNRGVQTGVTSLRSGRGAETVWQLTFSDPIWKHFCAEQPQMGPG